MIAAAGHRFSTVVHDLRRKGFEIDGEQTHGSVWRYRLVKEPEEPAYRGDGQGRLDF